MSVETPDIDLNAGRRGSTAEAVLSAVVQGAHDFLGHPDWAGVRHLMLERLGLATGSHQVRVFRNDDVPAGAPVTASLTAQWLSPEGAVGSPREMLQGVPYEAAGCGRWLELLPFGEPVIGNRVDQPLSEQPILAREGVVSHAIVPIFAGTRWFGFIGFADCVNQRTWSKAELDALAAGAGILGAAYARFEMEERIASAQARDRLAAEIGNALTTLDTPIDDLLRFSEERIAHYLNADLVRIWARSDNDMLESHSAAAPKLPPLAPSIMALGDPGIGTLALQPEPAIWNCDLPELWPGSTEELARAGLDCGAGFPLISNSRLVGVVVMLTRGAPPAEAIIGLESVTDELSLAIERSRTQKALHLSEDRYRRLTEATLEGICIHDGRQVIDCNPSLASRLGFESVDAALGADPLSFVHPDDRPNAAEKVATNYQLAYEARMVTLTGEVFPAELRGSDYLYDGRKLRVVAIRDISERKEAERMAKELLDEQAAFAISERRRRDTEFLLDATRILASSFDTTTTFNQLAHLAVRFLADSCVVTVFDGDAVTPVAMVHADPAKQELVERAVTMWESQWHGTHPFTVAQREGRSFIVRDLEGGELDEMMPNAEHRALSVRLDTRSLMSVPIESGGELLGSMIFSSSDPDHTYAEEYLALAQELGRRAAVAVLSARSYHAAEAATRARDDMLAIVAHDLRNPLNTIFMSSSLALEMGQGFADAPGLRQFEIIRRSAEHMNRLIQDLLDATRLQSGQLKLERTNVRVHSVVDQAIEILQPLALHAGIEFAASIEPDLPAISADPMRLQQVLSNLVGNALKFTPRGGCVTISVTGSAKPPAHLPAESDTSCALVFSVTDTGQGIPAEQLPLIFGRFWQARSTDRRGLGLGLSIAKGIVEAHDGTIWVESELGVGSSFRFLIPL